MNSKRSIRLFLFVAVVGVAAMFFAGYACGSYRMARSLTEQDAQYTKNETDKQKSTEDVGYVSEGGTWDTLNPDGTSAAANGTNTKNSLSQKYADASGQASFYLKDTGEYLTVYDAVTDKIYFETDLKAENLPEELRKMAEEEGITFSDLEELYHFLENYSS